MAKPNKTVAAFRRKHPLPDRPARPMDPELKAVFDAVQAGDMTPTEGAEKIRQMRERGGQS